MLGSDPQTGINRGPVQFATAVYVLPSVNDGPQWLARVDHNQSDRHRLSWRYTYDSRHVLPVAASFPGFVQEDAFSHHNFLFADSYTFGPSYTNEFRFSYGRPDASLNTTWLGSVPLAQTLPQITIGNVSAPGVASSNGSFHDGSNFLFQETQTKLIGRHAFRYGVELLRELVTQQRSANDLGTISFKASTGYSAFANFLDDFSGPSAVINRVFGASVFYPNQLHQTYFFQDNWKVTPTLAVTLGLRYENFGQYANALPYPAFSGFDPAQFLVRHEMKADNKDFGPGFGLAWSPASHSGWLGRLFDDGKTVWRGGYQISYDNLPTQLIARGPATTTPNAISIPVNAPNTGRGYQNPDTGFCVSPGDVHWVEGTGFPNESTVGRNTLRTGGADNFDLNLTKSIPLGEARRLELRWEALNAFNHPQYVNVPPRDVFNTLPGQFLNRDFTDSGIRSMWVQVKLVF
jgi:hypothetical protein